uniref:IS1595 family transposase n=1 Tax=Fundidesulfovibrio putealis TaxID=270496 RepID=A0A7C4EL56_9BACT
MDPAPHDPNLAHLARARDHVAESCGLAGVEGCPRCRRDRVYRLGSGRLRCPGCGYTFHDLTGRYLGLVGLRCDQWLRLIGLFVAQTPVKQASQEMGLAYNTTYKALHALRQAIVAQATDARQILSVLERGPGLGWPPVFGVMERGDWVFVDLLSDVEAADLTLYHRNFRLRTTRVGSVVYTGPMRGYQGLVCCGGPEWVTQALKGRDLPLEAARAGGFWNFVVGSLDRLQGVTPEKFPFYLKELEFRWNHRQHDLAERVLQAGLNFVQERAE